MEGLMSVDNKAIVLQHLERAWNQNNLTTIEECLSPEAGRSSVADEAQKARGCWARLTIAWRGTG
jgi:hypothetical protein